MTTTDDAPATTPAHSRRRPRGVWVLAALALVLLLIGLSGLSFEGKLSDVQKNDNSAFLPGSADSTKVSNASGAFSAIQTIPGNIVFQRQSGLTAADKSFIASRAAAFRKLTNVAADQVAQPVFSTTDPGVAQISVPLIGKQGTVSRTGPQLVDAEKAVIAAAGRGAPAGLVMHSAGAGGILVAFIDSFSGLDGTLLLAAGLVVIVILLFVYRSPVLWFFPLFSAGLALGTASLVIYPLAKHNVITLNGQSQGILSVLVIGAGTDYALLLVSRYREELHEFRSPLDAMVTAWKGAAQPILASAVTVILGLLCLTIAELNSTSGLGPVCAIGIACTVVIMLTVLPALLVAIGYVTNWLTPWGWFRLVRNFRGNALSDGRAIFWPKRPLPDHELDITNMHPVWSRFARTVTTHRRRSWAGAVLLLVICTAFVVTLKSDGLTNSQEFTSKPSAVVGQDIFDKAFPNSRGSGAPANILVNADKADAVIAAAKQVEGVDRSQVCVETDFAKLPDASPAELAQLGRTGCAPKALQVTPHDGNKLLVDATLTSSYDSSTAYATVDRLRTALSKIDGADALVGGSSATNLDIQNASRHDRDVIIPLVLLVILIILGLVLRALLAPILLIATVVLSFFASLGVSALFFNHVFHFANADPAFPLFTFVFLVALGIDYNIFLMTRVREETLEHGTRDGIVRGLAVTGGVITSAGIVLAATFVVLGVLPIVFLAEIGFAVAFGVLLDTIVVRSILVPALSYDLGKRIWWPSKLARAAD